MRPRQLSRHCAAQESYSGRPFVLQTTNMLGWRRRLELA